MLALSCQAARIINDQCATDPDKLRRAIGTCSFLLDERSFGACHAHVDAAPFIETCKRDLCRSHYRDTDVYFCTALAAYAEECARRGRVLDWRTGDICRELATLFRRFVRGSVRL